MIPKDKMLHLAVGAVVGAIGAAVMYVIFPNFIAMFLAGSVLSAVAGWLKEDYDLEHPDKHTYDINDARCTLHGGAVAAALTAAILISMG